MLHNSRPKAAPTYSHWHRSRSRYPIPSILPSVIVVGHASWLLAGRIRVCIGNGVITNTSPEDTEIPNKARGRDDKVAENGS